MKMKNAVLCAAAILTTLSFGATAESGRLTKTFQVGKESSLDVSISGGDIILRTWDKGEILMVVDGLDEDEFDEVKMTQSGSEVRVSYRPRWGGSDGLRFEFNLPAQSDADLRTAGGDIQVQGKLRGKMKGSTSGGDIDIEEAGGTVDMSTSGGDVRCGKVEGSVLLRTSGGDIELGTSNGDVEVHTSGGDIRIENVGKTLKASTAGGDVAVGNIGGDASLRTSGGDVSVGKVLGSAQLSTAGGSIDLKGANGRVTAKTAGGDIELRDVTGSIEAKTAGGDIMTELIPNGKGASRLSSSGGNLRLYISENAKVSIEAVIRIRESWGRGNRKYDIRSDFPHEKYEKDEGGEEIRGSYKLNGGGDDISLETVNGNIEIRKLRIGTREK